MNESTGGGKTIKKAYQRATPIGQSGLNLRKNTTGSKRTIFNF